MDTVRRNLDRLMRRANIGAKPLAKKAGLGETAVRDIAQGKSQKPQITTLSSLAGALNVSLSELLTEAGVAVVGKIGAGGSIVFEDAGEFDRVIRPPDVQGDLIGLEVVGESMLPKFDPGDVIYISRDHDGVLPEYVGSYCACRLASGETYLKILARGSERDRYTLRSLNAADMENQELLWATPVRAVLLRLSRSL